MYLNCLINCCDGGVLVWVCWIKWIICWIKLFFGGWWILSCSILLLLIVLVNILLSIVFFIGIDFFVMEVWFRVLNFLMIKLFVGINFFGFIKIWFFIFSFEMGMVCFCLFCNIFVILVVKFINFWIFCFVCCIVYFFNVLLMVKIRIRIVLFIMRVYFCC